VAPWARHLLRVFLGMHDESGFPVKTYRIDEPLATLETHAVQLARHLADLYRSRRFTDLQVSPVFRSARSMTADGL
jgi:hypothetical protein